MGTGPHLCFLHGFCESSQLWDPVIESISNQFTCITIDLPGFGNNREIAIGSLAEQATALNRLLAQFKQKIILYGHSMGGYIAIEMLSQNPELFQGIGLIHSTAKADSDEIKERRSKVNAFLEHHPKEEFLKPFSKSLVAEHRIDEIGHRTYDLVKETSRESIIAANNAMMQRKDHISTLEQTHHPIFFLCGSEDSFFTPDLIYSQAVLCNIAMVCTIKQCGHLSMYEASKECANKIVEFALFCDQWITSKPLA
ncbi:alpha/beta fold hydrolase [bacterium]|nr:alpha/beta fold hydrolase [bacterium]